MASRSDVLISHLFPDAELHTYAIVDAARLPGLPALLTEYAAESICIPTGATSGRIDEVSPHLVRLERDAPFTRLLVQEFWGKRIALFARASEDLRSLRRHFRSFLTVRLPDNTPVHFRYYDPRIFRVYMPTCNTTERRTVLGPVEQFLVEDGDKDTLLIFEGIEPTDAKRVRLVADAA